jgi:hypothetical protein
VDLEPRLTCAGYGSCLVAKGRNPSLELAGTLWFEAELVVAGDDGEGSITGEGPAGLEMPQFRDTLHNYRFKRHLEMMRPVISQMPAAQWDDALYAMALIDIEDPLNDVLKRHGLSGRDLESFEKQALTSLIQDLPSRQVNLQLHRQAVRNPQMKHHINDLEDWSGLAAAYCDVVVCDKHFADLILRDGFRPKARVITDVRALPEIDTGELFSGPVQN